MIKIIYLKVYTLRISLQLCHRSSSWYLFPQGSDYLFPPRMLLIILSNQTKKELSYIESINGINLFIEIAQMNEWDIFINMPTKLTLNMPISLTILPFTISFDDKVNTFIKSLTMRILSSIVGSFDQIYEHY